MQEHSTGVVSPSSFWAQTNLCYFHSRQACPEGCFRGAVRSTLLLARRPRSRAEPVGGPCPPGSAGHAVALRGAPAWDLA